MGKFFGLVLVFLLYLITPVLAIRPTDVFNAVGDFVSGRWISNPADAAAIFWFIIVFTLIFSVLIRFVFKDADEKQKRAWSAAIAFSIAGLFVLVMGPDRLYSLTGVITGTAIVLLTTGGALFLVYIAYKKVGGGP